MHFSEYAEERMIQPEFCRTVRMEVNKIGLVLPDGYSWYLETALLQPFSQDPLHGIEVAGNRMLMKRIRMEIAIKENCQTFFFLAAFSINFGKLEECKIRIGMCFIVLPAFQHGVDQGSTDIFSCLRHRHR